MLREQLEGYSSRMIRARGHLTEQILAEMRKEFKSTPPNVNSVLDLLQEILEERDLPYTSLVFVAAWHNLSQLYVPFLCKIVLNKSLNGWHEMSVDLLYDLPNPDAVEALKAAVDYRWDCDAFLCVPKKALEALSNINTPEAIEVITQASQSSDEVIREAATFLL